MKEMTYKTGDVSTAPHSFDIYPRKSVLTEVMPEIKQEKILAEPVIEDLVEAPTLVEDAVTEPAVADDVPVPKKSTKKSTKKTEENVTEVL